MKRSGRATKALQIDCSRVSGFTSRRAPALKLAASSPDCQPHSSARVTLVDEVNRKAVSADEIKKALKLKQAFSEMVDQLQ